MVGKLVKGLGLGAVVIVMGVAALPLWVPAAVAMAGFGAKGIVPGSWAAALMRSYGGVIPPHSLCAMLQRLGAKGLSTTTIVATECVAAAVAGLSLLVFKWYNSAGSTAVYMHLAALEVAEDQEPLLVEELTSSSSREDATERQIDSLEIGLEISNLFDEECSSNHVPSTANLAEDQEPLLVEDLTSSSSREDATERQIDGLEIGLEISNLFDEECPSNHVPSTTNCENKSNLFDEKSDSIATDDGGQMLINPFANE